ncbi:MAG: hypothetical protein RIQ29_59, partial [Pseudomonadota bacterium]
AELTIAKRIPQLEVALGETAVSDVISPSMARENSSIVWVIRILEPLTVRDEEKLRAFADRWHVQFWLQPGGPATASPFYPTESRLSYYLSEFSLEMPFSPVDFTQVNPAMNQVMVRRALGLLQWSGVRSVYCRRRPQTGLPIFSAALGISPCLLPALPRRWWALRVPHH